MIDIDMESEKGELPDTHEDDINEVSVVMEPSNNVSEIEPTLQHADSQQMKRPIGLDMLLGTEASTKEEGEIERNVLKPYTANNNTVGQEDSFPARFEDTEQEESFPAQYEEPEQDDSFPAEYEEQDYKASPSAVVPSPVFDAEQERTNTIREKEKILFGLYRLRKKGVNASTRYTIDSDLDTMRDEFKFLKKRVDMDASRAFSAKMLVMIVTAFEFMNDRWDPFDLYLDGWSESVHENIGDYDEVFDQLYEKYKEKMAVAPEVKLMLMLGGSAFMFHVTNSMFRPSGTKDTANLPQETVRNMMAAANREVAQSVPVGVPDRHMPHKVEPRVQNVSSGPSNLDKSPRINNNTVASLRQFLDTNSDNGSVTSSFSFVTKGGTRRKRKKTVARLKL